MSDNSPPRVAFSVAWFYFMKKELFAEALLMAHLMGELARKEDDAELIKEAQATTKKTLTEYSARQRHDVATSQSKSTFSCSFCGRSGEEIKLGGGPSALICSDCVSVFHDQFTKDIR